MAAGESRPAWIIRGAILLAAFVLGTVLYFGDTLRCTEWRAQLYEFHKEWGEDRPRTFAEARRRTKEVSRAHPQGCDDWP